MNPNSRDALGLDRERRQAIGQSAVLDARAQREGVDRRAQRIAAGAGAQELRVGLALELGEPVVEHLLEQALDEAAAVVADEPFAFLRAACE